MEHVQNKLDQAEVADIITSQKIAGSAGPTPGFVPACFYFLGVAVDALSLNTVAATPQHIVLLYLLREKRREETHSGYTLSQKLIATYQKFQINFLKKQTPWPGWQKICV